MVLDRDFSDVLKYLITLLTIINPIGVIPVFLSLTESFNKKHLNEVAKSCSIAVFVTLSLSLILGQNILGFFGISVDSFTIGGGILLFSMAFSMITASPSKAKINQTEMEDMESRSDLGVVPLAIPILAGPGAISTSIIQGQKFVTPTHWTSALVALILITVSIYFILRSSRMLGKKLGIVGMNVMTRVFGIILLAISIEMIVGGIKGILPILKMATAS